MVFFYLLLQKTKEFAVVIMDLMNNSYCRLCAKLKPNDKLSNFQADVLIMNELLEKLARINVHIDFMEDNYPKTVCILCFRTLDTAYEFAEAVEKAQNILQDIAFVKNEPKNQAVDVTFQTSYETFDSKHEYFDIGNCSNDSNNSIKTEIKSNEIEDALAMYVNNAVNNTEMAYGDTCRNWQDYNWTCSYCETIFLTIDELQQHSIELHTKCNAYRCADCGKRRHDLNGFVKHICTHKKHLKSSCYQCFVTFPITKQQSHKQTHITSEYVCIGCNKCFTSLENLERHKQKYYSFIRTNKLQTENQFGSCKICNKTFKNLSLHMLTHTERTRDHTCEKCGKSYFTRECLEQHYIAHSSDKPYECKICKQSFKTKSYLRCHVVVHNDVKPFSCDQCEKSYHRLKELNHHKKIHTDTWYECNICSKRYKLKKQLTLHLKLHSGVMPYSCEACQWNFTNYTNYFKHMRGKHNTDIRKKKFNSIDACNLEWKEELIRKKPRQRRRQIQESKECLQNELT